MINKTRRSEIELLRIISMLFVLIVHADGASLGLPAPAGWNDIDSRTGWQLMTESLTITGVNCFTLISGYFGIVFSWKKIGAYLFQCLYFAVGIGTIALFAWPARMNMHDWWEQWLVLTHTDLWYVPAYFCLMLIAPFINAGIKYIRPRDFKWCLVLFVLFNIWAGWWWEGKFNPTGYTVIQLIMMYLIGHFINVSSVRLKTGLSKVLTFFVYLVMTCLIFVSSVLLPKKAFAYNSPFVLGASVSLFLIFSSLSFKSKIINSLAGSAFAVYLVHKAPVIWVMVIKPCVVNAWNHCGLLTFSFFILGGSFLVYGVAWLADRPRRWISAKIWGRG